MSTDDGYQLEILLPRDGANALQQILVDGAGTLQYAKVLMKLSDLIEGDFFNQYIKSGSCKLLGNANRVNHRQGQATS